MAFLEAVAPRHRPRRQAVIRRAITPLTNETLVTNIIKVYEQATPDEHAAGIGWYPVAHEIAIDLGYGAKTGAGIIAALSPQLSWASNIAAAQGLASTDNPRPAGIGLFIDRARQIKAGADPDTVLGGRKVRSFYRNIMDPGTPGPVTIDRHAVSVAMDLDVRKLELNGVYTMVAAAYRGAGRLTDLMPHEIQAVTWVTYRRLLNDIGARGAYFRT